MFEKLKLAIRLTADPKSAVKAFADLKKKSDDTRRALEQTQDELKALSDLIKAAGAKDAGLAKQFEAAHNKARQLKTAWVEAQAKIRRALKQGRAKDILGLKPDQTKREIQRTIAALNRLKRAGRASMSDIARATDAARLRIRQLKSASESAAKSQSLLARHIKYLSTAGLGFSSARSILGTYRLADAHVELNNRLRLVTHSEANLAETRQRLYEISQITRTQIGANAALYSKFAMATQKTGHSQTDLLKVVSILNKQVAIGGSNAAEAAAGLLQFGQGLASGKLAGDELRSVLENLLGVSDGLIAGFKKLRERGDIAFEVTRGNIRQLAADGKLTARLLIEAVLASTEETERKFKQVEKTMRGGWTQVGNAIAMLIGQMNDAFQGAQSFADILGKVAERIGEIDVQALTERIGYLKNAIIALAIVVGARLSAAFYTSAASALKISDALTAAQGTMKTTSVAARRLGVAIGLVKRAARGLWAALGGLLGAIALGSYMLYEFATAHKSAAKATDEHTESVDALRHQIQGLPADAEAAIAKLAQMGEEEVNASRAAYRISELAAARKVVEARSNLTELETAGIQTGTKRVRTSGRSGKTEPTYRPATEDELALAQADLSKAEAELAQYTQKVKQHTAALKNTGPAAEAAGERITDAMKQAGKAFDQLNKKISEGLLSDRGRLEADLVDQLAIIGQKSDKTLAQKQKLTAAAIQLFQQRLAVIEEAAAETALRARLSFARAELSLTKDGLARQQAALERALDGRLVSIAEYYRKKAALDIQAIDAEIALKRQDEPSPENGIEIQRLEIKKDNILAENAREAKTAQDDLAESLRQVRHELARLQGQGAITREALAAEYADFRARLMAEDDAEGVSLIDQLIDVRHAEQRLRELEQTWQATQERLRVQQETINIDQDAGLITETEARASLATEAREPRRNGTPAPTDATGGPRARPRGCDPRAAISQRARSHQDHHRPGGCHAESKAQRRLCSDVQRHRHRHKKRRRRPEGHD